MNTKTISHTTTFIQTRPQSWTLPILHTTSSALENLAASYAPISLQQMDAVTLLNRIDTKFVMSISQLLSALVKLQPDYRMLSIQEQRLNNYRTLYFDTPDFAFYHKHVNGHAERYKVRSREYIDSSLSFLEVKHKTRKDRTIKERIPTVQPVIQMTPETKNWLHKVSPLDGSTLGPKLWNTFKRITLVNKQCCERVTLDLDLVFYAPHKTVALDGIAIAEVKTDTSNPTSSFLAQMRSQGIRSRGFSKYCIGISMMYNQVKKNAIKPKMLWLEKLGASQRILPPCFMEAQELQGVVQ